MVSPTDASDWLLSLDSNQLPMYMAEASRRAPRVMVCRDTLGRGAL